MEPFVDGGLIEIAIGLGLVSAMNFIFFRKKMLIVYSAVAVLSPFILLLFPKGAPFYIAFAFVLINSVMLVFLLWRQRIQSPGTKLFDLKKRKKQ